MFLCGPTELNTLGCRAGTQNFLCHSQVQWWDGVSGVRPWRVLSLVFRWAHQRPGQLRNYCVTQSSTWLWKSSKTQERMKCDSCSFPACYPCPYYSSWPNAPNTNPVGPMKRMKAFLPVNAMPDPCLQGVEELSLCSGKPEPLPCPMASLLLSSKVGTGLGLREELPAAHHKQQPSA